MTRQGALRTIRENVEAIAVAVSIALVIRTFAAEPYAIPTGSMAPTLLGAYLETSCPYCESELLAAPPYDPRAAATRSSCPVCGITGPGGAPCPSCGHALPEPLGDPLPLPDPECPRCGRQLPGDSPADVPRHGGDKILVDKVTYRFRDPRRWEVAVFRRPGDTSINFVKRIAGLPGEEIDLVGGDVIADGQIQQKPPDVQEGIWMLVSSSLEGWRKEGGDPGTIRDGELATFGREIRDRQAHNYLRRGDGDHVVGDLRLEVVTDMQAGEAILIIKRNGTEARASLSKDGRLRAWIRGESREMAMAPLEGPVRWGCQILDGEASAWVEGQDPLVLPWPDPPTEVEVSAVAAGAKGGDVSFQEISLYRDIHYFRPAGGPWEFPFTIGAGEYLMLGDNSPSSKDSRYLGTVPVDNFVGRAMVVFWPVVPWSVRRIP